MKATKVVIAAAIVAFMFLAVPFTSVVSDAAWAENNEKAVYYEADYDKLTWEKFSAITGFSDVDFSKSIMGTFMLYDNTSSYTFSDMKITVSEWYMGEASSLEDKMVKDEDGNDVKDKTVSYVMVNIQTVDFEFTAKAGAEGKMFSDWLEPYSSDINKYLDVDGKVAVNDTISISGSVVINQLKKTNDSYKDFGDDTNAGLYSSDESTTLSMSLTSSVKFVRGTTEKEYDYSYTISEDVSKSKVYDIGDVKTLTTDKYSYVNDTTTVQNSALNFNFDNSDHAYVPASVNETDSKTGYESITKLGTDYIKNKEVGFTNIITSPLSETELKTALAAVGTVSDKYSDVDNAYENFVNPAETPVNQGLFFGLFILIFAIAVVVALVYRERNKE